MPKDVMFLEKIQKYFFEKYRLPHCLGLFQIIQGFSQKRINDYTRTIAKNNSKKGIKNA